MQLNLNNKSIRSTLHACSIHHTLEQASNTLASNIGGWVRGVGICRIINELSRGLIKSPSKN